MHDIDTDHENPAVQALIDAAIAVDEQLPGAWSRVAEYLETYKDKAGTLGRRKLDGDGNTAELRVEDLHVVLGALETILDAHTGPDEPALTDLTTFETEQGGIGLADLDAKLDEILKHVTPLPTAIHYRGKLSPAAAAALKADWEKAVRGRTQPPAVLPDTRPTITPIRTENEIAGEALQDAAERLEQRRAELEQSTDPSTTTDYVNGVGLGVAFLENMTSARRVWVAAERRAEDVKGGTDD